MQVRAWGATDVGRQRDHNEDSFLCDPDLKLFVVCDGMGGHAAGEVASGMAVQVVHRTVRENQDLFEAYRLGQAQELEVTHVLDHAVQEACSLIYERAQAEPEKRGMGTTLDMLLIVGTKAFIVHVGDSRVYLVRHGSVIQLTEDHSVLNYLISKGRLKPEEVESSPYAKYKNAVTRAVGAYPSVEVDSFAIDVLPGDRFLLCSDGLHAYLDEDKILQGFQGPDLAEVTRSFIQLANEGGGHDNITAVVVHVPTEAEAEVVERAADIQARIQVLRQMPLFRHLRYKEIVRVLNITSSRWYQDGQVVIREGEPGEELYVVLEGQVEITKDGTYIATLDRGDHFGEMALVDDAPRSATAVAHGDAKLLVIHRRDFYDIIRKEPEIAVKLLWSFVRVLTNRLRQTTENLSGARLEAQAVDLSDEAIPLLDSMAGEASSGPPPVPQGFVGPFSGEGPAVGQGREAARVEALLSELEAMEDAGADGADPLVDSRSGVVALGETANSPVGGELDEDAPTIASFQDPRAAQPSGPSAGEDEMEDTLPDESGSPEAPGER